MNDLRRVVCLSGGVGGARLLHGLARALPADALTVIVNTGDDFRHWGLYIAPDLDTVMYTLSGLGHEARGWGLAEETFGALEMVKRYGGDDWFALGDRDLGTHLVRTEALARGETLSAITARLFERLGVATRVLPMADAPCRTMIDTDSDGTLPFQQWFVRRRAVPAVKRVWFDGTRTPAPGVIEAIEGADLCIIGPSNPYVSVDPILAMDGVRAALERRKVVALSPIVGGRAVKGPLAEMIQTLRGEPASPGAIVRHYEGLLRGIFVEEGDEPSVGASGCAVRGGRTVMTDRAESLRLARELLEFAATIP
ncbi:2-phospho-L-lactate transferase [Polyangium aurulentum]|uniref:2-phospho-L-lactate transferase n=1 Tax=Polyangium aurulentum TaxID=2567896 RepID=UPI0010AED199|nr:2-phospho-L-lactate transferase [Polyangium aurulentum]UQA56593.1 2-phospho-L-lactate transferase [Polyangium aurulentum]